MGVTGEAAVAAQARAEGLQKHLQQGLEHHCAVVTQGGSLLAVEDEVAQLRYVLLLLIWKPSHLYA